MIRKLRVKLVCILMALLTVMLGVTFGLVLHFTQQSLEAESLRTLEALANNWQTASSPGLDDGTRVPYFALEINARGDIITTRGGYFDLSDREKLQKLIDIAVNSEDDIGEVPDYGLRFYRVVTRTSWRVVFADTSAETTTLHSLIRTLAIASAAALAVFFVMSLLLARWLVRPVARAWDQQRQFVADASHELKTPLTSILGTAEILQNGLVKPEDVSHFAGNIHREAGRLIGLVNNIIKLSRLDEGGPTTTWENVDLYQTAKSALDRLSAAAEQRQVTLELRGEPVQIHGVPQIVDEILYNLCDNAVVYNRPGGKVCVTVEDTGKSARVMVEDTGIGIPQEVQSRVFERFYRADKSHSAGGTGLGLSIVKHGAAYLGAKVTLESEEGKGSTFTLIFPKSSM